LLIVGTNSRALRFAQKIVAKPELGYRLIGFLDKEWDETSKFQQTGYPLVSDFEGFNSFIRKQVVDEVIVCLPMKSFYNDIYNIISFCEKQGIIVRFLSDIFNLKFGKIKTEELEGFSVISIYTVNIKDWQALFKRIFDFTFSLFLLISLMPLFILTAILLKITSPGSVFFVQERIGINKRRFRLYKFRTMIQEAEKVHSELEHLNEVSGPVFKIKDDPRITMFGKFLRKSSIDELPQLFNVIKGEMSLVGPRPLPIRDYEGFEKDWQRRRFSVRPGITCLWQITGRSSISFDQWMKLDMQYIDEWSLLLDFKILAKTIPAVLRGSGAL
jgi:exopolysaccharide biosynthesis polyprenyl glycosylphosphotransferase